MCDSLLPTVGAKIARTWQTITPFVLNFSTENYMFWTRIFLFIFYNCLFICVFVCLLFFFKSEQVLFCFISMWIRLLFLILICKWTFKQSLLSTVNLSFFVIVCLFNCVFVYLFVCLFICFFLSIRIRVLFLILEMDVKAKNSFWKFMQVTFSYLRENLS